jgi:hypothetical protein
VPVARCITLAETEQSNRIRFAQASALTRHASGRPPCT